MAAQPREKKNGRIKEGEKKKPSQGISVQVPTVSLFELRSGYSAHVVRRRKVHTKKERRRAKKPLVSWVRPRS
jgi:hypothetical protein